MYWHIFTFLSDESITLVGSSLRTLIFASYYHDEFIILMYNEVCIAIHMPNYISTIDWKITNTKTCSRITKIFVHNSYKIFLI